MRERPIIFSAPMVRAILGGSKTQTRRVMKPQPTHMNPAGIPRLAHLVRPSSAIACPYGRPGDRLWVRETFCDDWQDTEGIYYRADGGMHADMFHAGCKWRPSIYMPRAASRITLEVTGVRVERLQDISYDDAHDEGTAEWAAETSRDGNKWPNIVRAYRGLWESINGAGSWDANPWVWVVEFRLAAEGGA